MPRLRLRPADATANDHAQADARCGRAWVCACAACRMTRRHAPVTARSLAIKNTEARARAQARPS